MYFGSIKEPILSTGWPNVCLGCGSGASVEELERRRLIRRRFFLHLFECPACGVMNPLYRP
jgi:hypothetical protein